MRIYGLTGGIGSGKSTVAKIFEACGIPVLYADLLARDAIAPGTEGLREVLAVFTTDVLDADGALDRRRLAQLIFNDSSAKRRLEAIIHPRVHEQFGRRTSALAAAGVEAMIYEVPILFERDLDPIFTAIMLVCSPEHERVRRVAARDGVSPREVRDRMHNQLPDEQKRARATYVIENDAGIDKLRERVRALALELFGVDSPAAREPAGD